jgi:hypothetical protein
MDILPFSEAKIRSDASAMPTPPPAATPLSAQITGLGNSATVRMHQLVVNSSFL